MKLNSIKHKSNNRSDINNIIYNKSNKKNNGGY
jgi:hypothetical protein